MEYNSISTGNFCGSVLLSQDSWDKSKLLRDLQEEWGIEFSPEDTEGDPDIIVSDMDGYKIAISKFPVPVPNNEAEINAANNFLWEEAVEVTSTHKAHIVVAVLGDEKTLIERGMTYVKIMAACTKQQYAIGVFTSGVVFKPSDYFEASQSMKEDILPIPNWIWFGLYATDKGISAYTYGMDVFGKRELEVVEANAEAMEVYNFLFYLASYVLEADVMLQDGETIGFSEDDIHEIKLSKGIALPEQDTLKISYEPK